MNELLKVKDIQARLGIGRSAVYALIHEPSFPAPIAINSRTLRWEITEFEQWLLSRKSSLRIPNLRSTVYGWPDGIEVSRAH